LLVYILLKKWILMLQKLQFHTINEGIYCS
jgi:hypothetical protein